MKESFDKHDAATAEDILSFLKANDIDLDMLSFQTYNALQHQCLEELMVPKKSYRIFWSDGCLIFHAKDIDPTPSTNIATIRVPS